MPSLMIFPTLMIEEKEDEDALGFEAGLRFFEVDKIISK